MRIDEFILLALLKSDENTISGRTLLQKKLYFLNEKLKLGFRFVPYYYGPYNFEIAESVESLKSSGIIVEKMEGLPNFNDFNTIEPKRYTYALTKIGKNVAEYIEEDNPEEAKNIMTGLAAIKKLEGNIIIAAKMHHILKVENVPMKIEEILEEADSLGWKISEDDAKKALEFLRNIKMINEDKED